MAAKTPEAIQVTLPDGKVVAAESWRTSPYDVARGIRFVEKKLHCVGLTLFFFSQGLADSVVIAKVDKKLWDLDRPLEASCNLKLLKFDDEEAQAVFWHSTAHIMGEAMERLYGGLLCYGPPIDGGFYYDMYSPEKQVSNNDFPVVEAVMKKIIKEKQPFERLELSKEELLKMFEVIIYVTLRNKNL